MKKVDFGILVLGYRRSDSIKMTITSLENLSLEFGAPIYVYVDGAKGADTKLNLENTLVKKTVLELHARGVVHDYTFCETNSGTMKSVCNAVTCVLKKHENILVFEDDLQLINDLVIPIDSLFASLSGNISAFSLYCNKTYSKVPFVSRRFSSQGWGTSRFFWNDFDPVSLRLSAYRSLDYQSLGREVGKDMPQAWKKFIASKVDSWAIPWNIYNFKNDRVMVYPDRSFVISNSHLPGAQRTGGIEFEYEQATSNFKQLNPAELSPNLAYLKHFTIYARIRRRLWKYFFELLNLMARQ